MKKSLVLLLAVLLIVTQTITAQSLTRTEQRIADWQRAKTYTKEYLSAASDELLSFKPTPEVRSFAEQMLHLAEDNYLFAATAAGEQPRYVFRELETKRVTSIAVLEKIVLESYDYVIDIVSKLDEVKMLESVNFFELKISREAALAKGFEHQTHHRGQTTVYLRLKGIKPPEEKLF
ncbi:MAG: DinB family protein [Cyclobacteriaceae bacterium]|nr:DinB family protein [Cyclobacteriaceae bacterium]